MQGLSWTGRLIGVRDGRVDKETGELATRIATAYNDLYGVAEMTADAEMIFPEIGTVCEFALSVRAYSGFVKFSGGVGDARVDYRCIAVVVPAEYAYRAGGSDEVMAPEASWETATAGVG
jgi:hypothetical protein